METHASVVVPSNSARWDAHVRGILGHAPLPRQREADQGEGRDVDVLKGAALVLVAACAGGGHAPTPRPLPAAWRVASCLVVDSAASPSTVTAIGVRLVPDGTSAECAEAPRQGATPQVNVVSTPAADLRDVLDVGLTPEGARPDVIASRDPGLIAYAATREGYFTAPLPWSLTYVMLSSASHPLFSATTIEERESLARDAVRAAARGAREPFPWLTDSSCAATAPSSMTMPRRVVAYSAGDDTARELAERIAALAGPLQVVPMPVDSMNEAIAQGRIAGAVHAVARDPRARCMTREDARVASNAIPLVDAREHAIVRRGSGVAFVVAPDGSVRFITRRPR